MITVSEQRCRICLESLGEGEFHYHLGCCRKLFGTSIPPTLPFTGSDLTALAEQVVRNHITVPGVQPKLSLHLERAGNSDGGRLTLVGLEGGFILKPSVPRYPEMAELEHLTMRMAKCFGIETAESGLIEMDDGKMAFIVSRMDRVDGRKLLMEDMCQLSDRLSEEKYRGSMESIGKIILKHCANPGFDALRFFEVTLFCFLTGNADMHFKNFSLIRSTNGEIHYAAAYDLLPTVLLLPQDTEESALTIHGKKRRLGRKDFLAFGSAFQLSERQMANSIRRFEKGMPSAIQLIHQGFCSVGMMDRYKQLVSDRWARLMP
jgi:serine/threonine-protein kinase HipA